MLCETAREHLNILSDGEQLNNQRQLLLTRRHCLTCPACRAYQRQLRQISQTARHLPVSLPAELRERVLSQLPPADIQPSQTYITHTTSARRRELAMLKRLTAITGAVLVAAVAATLATKLPVQKTVRQQTETQTESMNRRGQLLANDLATYNKLRENLQAQLEVRVDTDDIVVSKPLRDRWRGWAMQHREELYQMLHAHSTDQVALMRIYTLLPTGFYDNSKDPLAEFLTHKPGFSWQLVTRDTQGLKMYDQAVLNDFAEYHDIKLLVFPHDGQAVHTLWASGRVTASKQVRYTTKGGRLTLIDVSGPHDTQSVLQADSMSLTYNVFPPYEELTR